MIQHETAANPELAAMPLVAVPIAAASHTCAVRILVVSVLLIAACGNLAAQRYTFRNYARSSGLKNLNMNCLIQDHEGNLWAGTESGVYRYSGDRFQRQEIAESEGEDYITSIYEDPSHRLWISTLHHVILRDPDGGMLDVTRGAPRLDLDPRTSFAALEGSAPGAYLISARKLLQVTSPDGGKTWKIMPAIASELMVRHPELGDIVSVYSQRGSLWLGCASRLCQVNAGSVRIWTEADGLPADRWHSISMDRKGMLWVRGERHIYTLPAGASRFVQTEQGLATAKVDVRSPFLLEDPSGCAIINISGGLALWKGGRWVSLGHSNGMPLSQIQAMMFDRLGSPWLGSGNGVDRWLGYGVWESWNNQDGLSANVVWSIHESSPGNLWIGTETGVDRFVPASKRFQRQVIAAARRITRIQTIARTADGHLWLGSDGGAIYDYDPAAKRARTVGQPGQLRGIVQLYVDRSDRLWVCSLSGVFYLDPARERTILREPPPGSVEPGGFYRAAQDTSGVIWFTAAEGIYSFDGRRWAHLNVPPPFHMAYSSDFAISADGSFWIPVSSGAILHCRMTGAKIDVLEQIDASRLASADIILVQFDRRGWLWVGSDSGLDVFNGREWRRFTEDDGLIWNDIDSGGFYSAPDGSVWIGTSGGISHILDPEKLFASQPLEVELSAVRLGSREISPSQRSAALPWTNSPLSFKLTASNLARADAITFRYFLGGLESGWLETAAHELRYPALPPGRYHLSAEAVDASRHQRSRPVTLDIEISPPWWRTQVFYGGIGCAFLVLLAIVWRRSNGYLIERQTRLEALVRARTGELEAEKAELLNARAALVEQATRDSLTGLLNRGAIFSLLARELERALRDRQSLTVALADVDHFKAINDTHGHMAGDHVLREISSRFMASIRSYDHVGRYGGEEFLLVLPGVGPENVESRFSEMLLGTNATPIIVDGRSLNVTCSFGVAFLDGNQVSSEELLEAADKALYAAKAGGRNRFEVHARTALLHHA